MQLPTFRCTTTAGNSFVMSAVVAAIVALPRSGSRPDTVGVGQKRHVRFSGNRLLGVGDRLWNVFVCSPLAASGLRGFRLILIVINYGGRTGK